jgi:hypothetical protein
MFACCLHFRVYLHCVVLYGSRRDDALSALAVAQAETERANAQAAAVQRQCRGAQDKTGQLLLSWLLFYLVWL